MLDGAPVLIVEDQVFIALDIAFAVEDAGGTVIGPAPSIKKALELLNCHSILGAILDVNLPDGDISPVVDRLLHLNIPMVLQSGVGLPAHLESRFPRLIVLIKPVTATALVTKLHVLMGNSSPVASVSPWEPKAKAGHE